LRGPMGGGASCVRGREVRELGVKSKKKTSKKRKKLGTLRKIEDKIGCKHCLVGKIVISETREHRESKESL